jgi:glutamate carboxypeptidase
VSIAPQPPEDLDAPTMVEALRRLVEAESFSADPRALEECADLLDSLCRDILGRGVERLAEGCLAWHRPGERPVLLLCHYDTVWPTGTLEDFPFTIEDGTARGPGVFDMKGGIVQALFALSLTEGPATLLLTPDEEVGSPRSRRVIEDHARGARAALVLEPAADDGGIKVARKGVAHWRVRVWGRAAHAGLEPEKGVNAVVELAEQIRRIGVLAHPDMGTSVAVTRVSGGTADNVIPESAWCEVDARMWTLEEATRLEQAMEALAPIVPGARLEVEGGLNRGPLERAMSEPLYRRLLGLGYDLPAVEVGGGSDASFTAAMGIPTLDGLGAVGGGAHARSEHLVLAELPRRAAMLARLLEDLQDDG